jgi:hypothetical protein
MTIRRDMGAALTEWARKTDHVEGLVLFGSRARQPQDPAAADGWSDIDLQVITRSPQTFEKRAWFDSLESGELCLYVVRPASGGVRKVTLISPAGEADLVIIPSDYLRQVRAGARRGSYRRQPALRSVLNEFSTIMGGGYRFLKGEKQWGNFYAWAVAQMRGQRLDDAQTARMADVFLCDLLWVFQRIARGELVAAQRSLHRLLAETNFQLLHEARLRRKAITFREARRVERLLSARELARVQVSAALNAAALRRATRQAYRAFRRLMADLNPPWSVPACFGRLLAPYLAF